MLASLLLLSRLRFTLGSPEFVCLHKRGHDEIDLEQVDLLDSHRGAAGAGSSVVHNVDVLSAYS